MMTHTPFAELDAELQHLVMQSLEDPDGLLPSERERLARSPDATACLAEMARVQRELDRRGAHERDAVLADALRPQRRTTTWVWWAAAAAGAAAVLLVLLTPTNDRTPGEDTGTVSQPFTLGGEIEITATHQDGALRITWPAAEVGGNEIRLSALDPDGAIVWETTLPAAATEHTVVTEGWTTGPWTVLIERMVPPFRVLSSGWIEIPQ